MLCPNESSLQNLASYPLVKAKLKTALSDFLHVYRIMPKEISIPAEIFF